MTELIRICLLSVASGAAYVAVDELVRAHRKEKAASPHRPKVSWPLPWRLTR